MERPDRAAVATFHAPGDWGAVVELAEAAAHHVQVKRLVEGDVVRITSGNGRRAIGTLSSLTKRRAAVHVDAGTLEAVAPLPSITMLAPIGDRDRMLLLAEKAVELGITAWQPVLYQRSRSVSPRGEGAPFHAKVRLRMISALEQSGGAWLPALCPDRSPSDALVQVGANCGVVLEQSGASLARVCASLGAPCAVAIGPEGGFAPGELDEFIAAGWRVASLGDNVLRFETAGIAALAVLRAHLAEAPA